MSEQASLGDTAGSSRDSEDMEGSQNQSRDIYTSMDKASAGDPPEEWNTERLGGISGKTLYGASKPAENFDPDKPRYLRVTDLYEDRNQLKDKEPKSISRDKVEKYILEKGDMVFARSGSVGKTFYISESDQDYAYGGYLIKFPLKNKKVNPYYLQSYTHSPLYWNWVERITRTGAQPNINAREYSSLLIPIPPKQEQRCIASVLYNVDQAIRKTEKIIKQTQRVKKGLMQDLFTKGYFEHEEYQETRLGPKYIKIPKSWKITRFEEISEVQQGLQIAKSKRYKQNGENRYRYITVQHLKDPSDEKQRWFIENPRENVICTEEDVLMTRTGNTGQVVTNVKGVFHNNFFKVNFDRNLLDKKFLVSYLRSEIIQNLLVSYAGITTIPDLNHADFGRIPLLLPSKEEQRKISDVLNSVEQRIEQEKETKEQLQRLKKGLMQDLLTGKVRTKDKDIKVLDEVMEVEN